MNAQIAQTKVFQWFIGKKIQATFQEVARVQHYINWKHTENDFTIRNGVTYWDGFLSSRLRMTPKVSLLGVDSLWGDCILADWAETS